MLSFEKEIRGIVKDELIKLLSKDSIALNEAIRAYASNDIISDNLLKIAARTERKKGYFVASDLICDECASITKAMTLLDAMEIKGITSKNSKMQYKISEHHASIFDFLDSESSDLTIKAKNWMIRKNHKTMSPSFLSKNLNTVKSSNDARQILESLESESFLKPIPNGSIVNGKYCREAWEVVK